MKLDLENENLIRELNKCIDSRSSYDVCADIIAIKEKLVARLWVLQCRETMFVKQRDILIDIKDLVGGADL
jgi:hypothetical protein